MESPPPTTRPRYVWPRYLLAALAMFLFVCIVWTYKEVRRLQRAKQDSQQDRAPAGLITSNQPPTNSAR